jgi:hypothetical protein
MSRASILRAGALVLLLAGCARPGAAGNPDRQLPEAFEQRAATVAAAWHAAGVGQAWRSGFVPMQELVVVPPEVAFPDQTKVAFEEGWYRLAATLPGLSARSGDIRFPDGSTLSVPLLTAAEAYQNLDRGDPTCASCPVLTVTGARLATVPLMTSRGRAEVPAWLFTITGLAAPIARVAVVPSAVGSVPDPPRAPDNLPGLVRTEALTGIDGAVVDYKLGVGACDSDITPLSYETDDVVVIGGSVHRSEGMCVLSLKLAPVRVTLAAPVGNRTVLDGLSGRPLVLQRSN